MKYIKEKNMKVAKRTQAIILCIALALLCFAPTLPLLINTANRASAASENLTDAANYYGKKLTDPVSVAFYDALEKMDFASGKSVQLYDKAILDEASLYTVGNPSVIQKLGAAVDSFRYDHTEYFYVDFDKLTLNVKTKGNTLIVELGAGRSDSYFAEGFTASNVGAAIERYNGKLDKFVDGITLPNDATTEQKAKAVTKAVAEKITYDFCVDENGNDTEGAPFIRTAYGALEYGKGVCEGYSRLFKAAMDKLGETTVLINGWLATDTETGAHMWNLVKDGNHWYGVDVTVADEDNSNYNAHGYDWARGEKLGIDHFEDRIVSTSNYEMPFPTIYREGLKEVNAPIEQEVGGLKVEVSDDKQIATISYNGKDAEALKQDELYMTIRIVTLIDGVTAPNVVWEPISNYNAWGWVNTADGKTTFNLTGANQGHVQYVQFGICNADADVYNVTTKVYDRYSDAFFDAHVVAKTEKAFINENAGQMAPTELRGTPNISLISLDTREGEQPQNITIRYNRDLAFDNPADTQPVVTFTTVRTADGTILDVGDLASISNVQRVGNDSISFVFRPSISFSHNEVTYKFHLDNMHCVRLNGETGKPADVNLEAIRTSIVCNKVFGDGKLYVEAFGTPTLVDNSDLSVKGWTYKDENNETRKVSDSQRSQLALVVKTPANKNQLENSVESSLGAGNVQKMATYELDLNICSRIASIPADSYLKLSFGFPEGITADMEGVEFEVFHFKKDASGNLDYSNPERLNCVVTKYGLTVTVNSFSPFVIVARNKTAQDDTRKGIVTALNGLGGTITADTNKPVNFLLADGDKVTYTLTPEQGYAVEYVLLGDKELTVENGKVTVNYSDLTDKNNVLSVGFAKLSVIEQEKANGEISMAKAYAASTYDKSYAAAPKYDYPTNGLSGGIIALIVIIVVLVVAGGAVLAWFLIKKKGLGQKKA